MGSVNTQTPSLDLSNPQKEDNGPSPPPTPTGGLARNLSVTSLRRTNSTEKKEPIREVINIETPDPSHLYWVPAEQHPEIAPAEFNNWLQHHAYNSERRPRIRRRRSVLSVSYTPDDIEADEEAISEPVNESESGVEAALASLERGSRHITSPPQSLEPNREPDPARKDRIRRSVSLSLPIISEQSDHINVFDRNSSPYDESRVLVPRADSSLLRRGARTKIRRNSTMDSSSGSSNDSDPFHRRSRNSNIASYHTAESQANRTGTVPPGGISLQDTPVIIVEEADKTPLSQSTFPPPKDKKDRVAGPRTSSLPSAAARDVLAAKLEADERQDTMITTTNSSIPSNIPAVTTDTQVLPSPPPPTPPTAHAQQQQQPQSIISTEKLAPKPPSPTRSVSTGRKSTWSRLFRTDDSNKTKKNRESTPVAEPIKVEEPKPLETIVSPPTTPAQSPSANDSIVAARKFGSLSSLFSRASVRPVSQKSESIIGSPKSNKVIIKKTIPLPKRLPIHVERAVYRLSHMKLANPRRPLQHQVLISNFMFWYLSIVDGASNNGGGGEPPIEAQPTGPDKKGKKINKLVAAGKKRRQEIIQNKQRKAQIAHERMGARRSETVIPSVQYDRQVRHQLPHVGPRGPLMTPQHYLSTAGAPTGFVVPQQYLHPKNSTTGGTGSEDDDDDEELDEEEEEEEDEEEEEEEDDVQWPLPPHAPQEKQQKPSLELNHTGLGAFSSDLIDMIKFDEEDDVPLAMYRKSQ